MRIWRHADNRPFVDVYLQDRHFNCEFALGARKPIKAGMPDHSYAERMEPKREEQIK